MSSEPHLIVREFTFRQVAFCSQSGGCNNIDLCLGQKVYLSRSMAVRQPWSHSPGLITDDEEHKTRITT